MLIMVLSGVPVEQLFSAAGKVFRLERCRLKDETFYRLMFVPCNNKIILKTIGA